MFEWLFGRRGGPTNNEILKLAQRNPFSNYLPWIAYDPETHVYVNRDDTVGFMWECAPLAFAGEKSVFVLQGLFRMTLPERSVIQFILYADPNIDMHLQGFLETKTRQEPLCQSTARSYADFYRKGASGMPSLNGIPIRNFRLFCTLKVPTKASPTPNMADLYNSVTETLRGAYLFPRCMEPPVLLDFMRRIFNKEPSVNNWSYDDERPLYDQVINADSPINFSMSEASIGERYFRCTTVKNYPKIVDPLQTNECTGGCWGIISDSSQITTPFLFVMNIIFHNLKFNLHRKCSLLLQQKAIGSFAPSIQRKQEEYLNAVDDLEAGVPFVRIMPICWTWHDTQKGASEAVIRIKRLWESHGYIMQEDRGILQAMFISALPMGLYDIKDNVNTLNRDFITPAPPASKVLPVQADFAGGGVPQLLFVGRKGQIATLDLFDKSCNNHNAFVAASSGSGKSFLINYITFNYYAAGAKIRIIDIGGSYQKMATMLGGRYLDFGRDSNMCMNPFTNVSPENIAEEISVIAAIVRQMAYSATDSMPFDTAETEMSLIRAAIRAAWRQYGNDASIDAVYDYLKNYPAGVTQDDMDNVSPEVMLGFQQIAAKLAFNLIDYTSRGSHGRWFNGPANFDIANDDFVVLELENLKPQKELFRVITLQVINAVTRDLYLSDRSQRRLIVFDEAWQFIRDGSAIKDVVEEGYRRARKYGGSFTVVTQSLLDLQAFGSVGNVIRANSAFLFLPESPDFDRAKDLGYINYDEFTMKLLKSVKSCRPKYSEIFIDTPFGPGIIRLSVDPYSYYVYTSDPKDTSAINALVASGKTYAEAIDEMVRMHRS